MNQTRRNLKSSSSQLGYMSSPLQEMQRLENWQHLQKWHIRNVYLSVVHLPSEFCLLKYHDAERQARKNIFQFMLIRERIKSLESYLPSCITFKTIYNSTFSPLSNTIISIFDSHHLI